MLFRKCHDGAPEVTDTTGDGSRDDDIHYWLDQDGIWTTDFPPPADFDGVQDGNWSSRTYSRPCTAQECDVLVRLDRLDQTAARAAADRRRDRHSADMVPDLALRSGLPASPSSA